MSLRVVAARPTIRVAFWGILEMAPNTGIRALLGKVVQHRGPVLTGETRVGLVLKAVIVSAFLMLAGVEAIGAPPLDEQFVRYEAQRSTYELAFARLGEARATRPEIRAYATTLVNDHEAYNGALRDLAETKGITVPSGMAKNDQTRLDRLTGTGAAAFDTAFIREARRMNGGAIRAFRRETSRTIDPDIRRFVTRFLEVEEKHDSVARRLAEGSTAAHSPIIHPPRTGDTMPIISPPNTSKMPVISPSDPAPK